MSLPLDSAEDMMDPSNNSPAIQSHRSGRDDIRSQTGVDVRLDVQVCVWRFRILEGFFEEGKKGEYS